MEAIKKYPNHYVLMLLQSLAAVNGVFFTPGLPSMAKFFDVSANQMQMTIYLFVLAYAVGQLFAAPLAERIGERKTLAIGNSLAIIGALFSGLSGMFGSFNLLMIARFVTALGASFGYALTFSLINHFYKPEQARKIVPKVALGLMFLPFVSVFFSGFLEEYLGWESCFYFMTVYSALVFILAMTLPESPRGACQTIANDLRAYWRAVKTIKLPLYSIMIGLCVGTFYVFVGIAPFVVIDVMQIPSSMYGVYNLILTAGLLTGNFLAINLAHRFTGIQMLIMGIFLSVIGSGLVMVLFSEGYVNVWALYLPLFVLFIGFILVWSNSVVCATRGVRDRSYAASAMAFINLLIAFLTLLFTTFFSITNPIIFAMILLSFSLAMVVLYGIIHLCGFATCSKVK